MAKVKKLAAQQIKAVQQIANKPVANATKPQVSAKPKSAAKKK